MSTRKSRSEMCSLLEEDFDLNISAMKPGYKFMNQLADVTNYLKYLETIPTVFPTATTV